jgi:phage gp29-like protein
MSAVYSNIIDLSEVRTYKGEAPPPRPSMTEVAHADPSRLFPTGPSVAYNPNALITRRGYMTIVEMLRDDQIKAALAFKKNAVMASGWSIHPPEGMDEDDERVEFCRNLLKNLEGSFESTLLEIMTALEYGFSVTERVWKEDADGALVYRSLKTRAPQYLHFKQDVYGNVTGIRQNTQDLPLEKFIIYTYDGVFSNPYGTTDLEAAYRPWWVKRNAYNWLAMFLERLGIPPIFALYNPNDYTGTGPSGRPKQEELMSVLRSLQAATVGIIPSPNNGSKDGKSIEMWTPELAGQIADVFIPAFDMFNKDISRSLLMPGLLGMTADDKQGSMARSKVHFDVFMLVLERVRRDLQEAVVNEQILKPALLLNFPVVEQSEMPRFEFMPIDDELRTELMTAWQGLVNSKIVTASDEDERHIRELFKFPEMDEESAKKRAEREMEQAAAATEANARAQAAGGNDAFAPFSEDARPTLTDEQFEVIIDRFEEGRSYAAGKVATHPLGNNPGSKPWSEEEHPRAQAGTPIGGQFIDKDAPFSDEQAALFAENARTLESQMQSNATHDGVAISSIGSGETKASIAQRIATSLRNDPHTQAFVNRYAISDPNTPGAAPGWLSYVLNRYNAKDPYEALASQMIGTWASTSGNENPLSIALQNAVRDEFGLKEARLDHFAKKGAPALHMAEIAAKQLLSHHASERSGNGESIHGMLRAFARAQYNETQKDLASMGVRNLYLYRGVGQDLGHRYSVNGAFRSTYLQPASSFTPDKYTAAAFGKTTMMVKVPRERVLSTWRTGLGCRGEHEVVVLGGKMKTLWTTKATMKNKPIAAIYANALKHEKPKVSKPTFGAASKNLPPVIGASGEVIGYKPYAEDEDPPLDLDSDLIEADWIKTLLWDVGLSPEAFIEFIGDEEHARRLPAWQALKNSQG